MSNRGYQIRIVKLSKEDGGGYLATIPELPGCMSDGETYEEALKNVQDAIEAWIDTAEHRGQKIPEPYIYRETDDYSGKFIVRIPKELHKELSESAEEQGISLNQLVLYYLSKQAGIEEAKREGSTTKLAQKGTLNQNIYNYITVMSQKDWQRQQNECFQIISQNREVLPWMK